MGTSRLCRTLLNIDQEEKHRLLRLEQSGVMEVRPVALPEGHHLVGGCRHLSHPVATLMAGTHVVLYRRSTSHDTKMAWNESCLMSVITRSIDGGATWSPPIDLRASSSTESAVRCYMAAIGSDNDGIVVVCFDGVFRSEDGGATWRRLPGRIASGKPNVPMLKSGGRILSHPKQGLVFTAHNATDTTGRQINRDNGEYNNCLIPCELWVCSSVNKGESWHARCYDLPTHGACAEPAPIFWADHLIVIGRSHSDEAYDPQTRTWRYVQLVLPPGENAFRVQFTSMRASDAYHISENPTGGSHCQDTVAIDLNPVTGRLEAVVSNRDGGGEGAYDDQSHHTLNLYSIDPQSLIAGSANWQFECTLFRRQGIIHSSVEKERLDGMHPAGAIMDAKNHQQFIYVYCGFRYAPSGIFQIRRNLKTQSMPESSAITEQCIQDTKDRKV